ncbi:MAG: START domain-containing protein [Desulfomonilia bacterium]
MRQFGWLCIFFVFLVSGIPADAAEGEWVLKKDEEGIKVYTRTVEGSDANEFQGIADIDAPLDVILEVFKDIPSFPQWYGFCKDIRQLKQDTETHRVIYFVLETPWPVKDRDMVIDVVEDVDKQAGKALITMNVSSEDLVPPQKDYVRMTVVKGMSVLDRAGDDKTRVVYTVLADPAGYIPAAISNMLQKEQPFLTLKGLREMVKKDIYYEKAGIVGKN